ncbi:tetratricopeptide repeat protein [Roseobacter sp.]|uniref:tetratricopeptide repeat protein n=1 Tax=Roseobacter sp. TaxID=1907202 RepID=UPI00385F4BB5
MKILTVLFSFLAIPLLAACPEPVDYGPELDSLFEEARAASNDMAGREVSNKMWQVWLRAPDAAAQEVLDRGMRNREVFDFVGALDQFSTLIDYCPTYAEGFNQRAYIHFLRENYEDALIDLDRALDLSPLHVAAQSGRALTLMNLGRTNEAREQLQSALELNPWLSERFLLEQGGPLAPLGKDI